MEELVSEHVPPPCVPPLHILDPITLAVWRMKLTHIPHRHNVFFIKDREDEEIAERIQGWWRLEGYGGGAIFSMPASWLPPSPLHFLPSPFVTGFASAHKHSWEKWVCCATQIRAAKAHSHCVHCFTCLGFSLESHKHKCNVPSSKHSHFTKMTWRF